MTRVKFFLGAAIALAALGVWLLSEGQPDPAGPRPVRLAELLDVAAITSPLTDISAVESAHELREAAGTPVHAEDFEDFDWEAVGWSKTGMAEIDAVEEGHAFVLRGAKYRDLYGWVVPAQPATHYRFERSVRTATPLQADFVVIETMLVERHDTAPNDGALRVHRAEVPAPDGTWQRGAASFFTQPNTYAFTVALRPMWESPEIKGEGFEAWFDDIRLVRVEPTPEQMVGLLKARSLAQGADPELGIEKHGQFPPLRELSPSHGPVGDSYSHRYALYAPPPTDLAFDLSIPERATLRFSVALSRETPRGDAAGFEVIARAGDGDETLWSRTVTADEEDWRWHDEVLDLARFAGRSIRLVLRTTAAAGHPHPVWGNPVLDVPPAPGALRNVILIAVDTLRADRLGCYGYDRDTSPHIDALAADGVRFEHVVANATWTSPSFASIFTGLVPSRHGVVTLAPMAPVPAALDTLAERFRAEGWATHSIAYKPPLYDAGYEQGFDVAINALKVHVRAEENLAEAMEWLESNAERRNFLFLHFDDPHQPFTQPPPFDRAFGGDPAAHGIELPHSVYRNMPDTTELRDAVSKLYDGEIGYVDDQIGAFLAALKKRGLYDGAVIAFVSDHGEQLWEHGTFGHGGTMVHDEVARVPMIVKPPGGRAQGGRATGGRVVGTQVRAFDVMPTLLEMAGLSPGDELDAESLVPLLDAETDAPHRVAVTEAGRVMALRNPAWKYILSNGGGKPAVEVLHDLRADPLEQDDVAGRHPDVVEQLRMQMLEYYMLRRPGEYLVAIDPDAGGERELDITGVRSAMSLFGVPARSIEGDTVRFGGEPAGPLLLVAAVELADTPACPDWNARVWDHGRYGAGNLSELLAEPVAGIHVFAGPPAVRRAESSQTLNAEQMRALRELGYAGSDGSTRPR